MCLFVHPDAVVETADHDIEVFKVLLKSDDSHRNHRLFSPFRMFVYEVGGHDYLAYIGPESKKVVEISTHWPDINETPTSVPEVLAKDMPECVADGQIGMVNDGIHTFANLEDAEFFIANNTIVKLDTYHPVIARCIIRAGIRHFSGTWMYHVYGEALQKRMSSYTSQRLDVIELV